MVIYCAGPIKGDTTFQNFYIDIIEHLSSLKHTALSELNEDFKSAIPLTSAQMYKRDMKWIERSKIVIAEISTPNTDIGFEIGYAIYEKKMPVLALVHSSVEKSSPIIDGYNSNLLALKKYSDTEECLKYIDKFIAVIQDKF